MRPYDLQDLPLAAWAHPLCGWDVGPDLAQATWEWPKRPWDPTRSELIARRFFTRQMYR
jgi:hypothetical protein